MMKKRFRIGVGAILPMLAFSACVDNAYDLSDIDTTTQLKVNDLVVPVNIADVTFADILSLDTATSKLKIIDNQYVFVVDGQFNSDKNIEVNAIHVNKPASTTTSTKVNLIEGIPGEYLPTIEYKIENVTSSFSYNCNSVDKNILGIKSLAVATGMTVNLSISDFTLPEGKLKIKDLEIQMPKGLELTVAPGQYDPATNKIYVPEVSAVNSKIELKINVSKINVGEGFDAKFNVATNNFNFDGVSKITGGKLVIERGAFSGTVPSQLTLVTTTEYEALDVTKFWGSVTYDIGEINISPVALTGIPNFLNQDGTNVGIANPQIYLSLNNPVGRYDDEHGITAQAALKIVPIRNGVEGEALTMPAPFVLKAEKGAQTFCLSPEGGSFDIAGYPNPQQYAFPSLSRVLSGNGIPESLAISVVDDIVPEQEVFGFPLGGEGFGTVSGKYEFRAPVALTADSRIVYTETRDGWNDEDVDKIVIEKLAVEAKVTNTSPFTVSLSGYPIGKDKQPISGVSITSTSIAAGQTQNVVIETKGGTIRHLDGFTFTATLDAGTQGVLSPSNNLKLENVRAKVSGSYTTDF